MDTLKRFVGAGFGSGYLPWVPGTWGSLAGLIVFYVLSYWTWPAPAFQLIFILLCCGLSLWVSQSCEEAWGEDPGKMVIDEWAGQGLALLYFPLSYDPGSDIIFLLAGFLLFRLFDILKPLGIKKLQNIHGGWGILLDDLLAGFYALICLKTLIFVWPKITGMA